MIHIIPVDDYSPLQHVLLHALFPNTSVRSPLPYLPLFSTQPVFNIQQHLILFLRLYKQEIVTIGEVGCIFTR